MLPQEKKKDQYLSRYKVILNKACLDGLRGGEILQLLKTVDDKILSVHTLRQF